MKYTILVTSILLNVESGYIYLSRNARSWMIDPIKVFRLNVKVPTNIRCTIFKVVKFFSLKIYILMKLIAIIKKN